MTFDVDWALQQLADFIDLTSGIWEGDIYDEGQYFKTLGSDDEIRRQAAVIEQILNQYRLGWKTSSEPLTAPEIWWTRHRNLALEAQGLLGRGPDIVGNLGDLGRGMAAHQFHPWVWGAARSLWESGHFAAAVRDVANGVSNETQLKIDRRDISETELFEQAFALVPPEFAKPRLRLRRTDNLETYKSAQVGAMSLARGLYSGIRNPLNHEGPKELEEQVAFEYLAAFSILARWVDDSTIEHAEGINE
jgi:hypothetical protein